MVLASETDGFLQKKEIEEEEEQLAINGRAAIIAKRESDKALIAEELGPECFN